MTGLDIGSSQIKCIVAEEGKNSLSVVAALKHPSSSLRRGVVVDQGDGDHRSVPFGAGTGICAHTVHSPSTGSASSEPPSSSAR